MATVGTIDPATVAAAEPRRRRTREPKEGGDGKWGLTILLLICSLTILVPLYFAVAMSLKSSVDAATGSGFSFPFPMHFENFSTAWTLTHFPRAFAISLAITAVSVAGMIIFSSLAAYAIARNWEKKAYRWSYFYLLAAMFIPFPVVALPQIKLTALVGLDNPVGVTILHIMFGLSFNVLLYTAFLRSVPMELEESARLDGCTTWQTFTRIVFPLLAPMNATVGIFAFLSSWNDFMMPSLVTSNPTLQTIPVIQNIFQSSFSSNYNIAFASYLMALAPTIVAYLIAQRWVLSGVTRGAIKG